MSTVLRTLFVICLLATACTGASPPPAVAQEQPLEIRSSSQPFKIDDPSAKTIGRLIWRGGIMMTANSPNFGGWSDLHVSSDSKNLTSISDEGAWLTATIEYDGEANLAGLSHARIGQLHGLDGHLIASKAEADAEAMALLPDGSWLVAFERNHRIWRYPTLTATPVPFEGPADIGRQPSNGGIEAMTALGDGRVMSISEEYSLRPGTVAGWIGTPAAGGRYEWSSFSYATIPDFSPTAIAQMPDGSYAMLERAFDFARGSHLLELDLETGILEPSRFLPALTSAQFDPIIGYDSSADGRLVAFGQQCSHLSCAVIPEPERGQLRCPCHNGYFEIREGRPIAGPPRRPLPRITLAVRDGTIYATGVELRTV